MNTLKITKNLKMKFLFKKIKYETKTTANKSI